MGVCGEGLDARLTTLSIILAFLQFALGVRGALHINHGVDFKKYDLRDFGLTALASAGMAKLGYCILLALALAYDDPYPLSVSDLHFAVLYALAMFGWLMVNFGRNAGVQQISLLHFLFPASKL
jgi:hypothetical protein